MERIEPRTLSGFMELLPNEQILFEQMKNTIEEKIMELQKQKKKSIFQDLLVLPLRL